MVTRNLTAFVSVSWALAEVARSSTPVTAPNALVIVIVIGLIGVIRLIRLILIVIALIVIVTSNLGRCH